MRNGSYRKGSSFQIRGVSDLVVYLDGGKTIWMEVKTAKGTLSEYQKTFSKRLEELGHTFTVVRSVEDAIGACKSFK